MHNENPIIMTMTLSLNVTFLPTLCPGGHHTKICATFKSDFQHVKSNLFKWFKTQQQVLSSMSPREPTCHLCLSQHWLLVAARIMLVLAYRTATGSGLNIWLTSSEEKTWQIIQHFFGGAAEVAAESADLRLAGFLRAIKTTMFPISAMYEIICRAWSIMASWKQERNQPHIREDITRRT